MEPLNKPDANIGEVTLFGTGGGYGESCLIHLGNESWVLVDSCKNPKTKTSLPLEYLEEINVDIEKCVKLIVCTHWHDDHIGGISQVLAKAPNSDFSIANAVDREKFLQMVKLDYKKLSKEASNVSTYEFNKCIEILENRSKKSIKLACLDKLLFRQSENSINSEVLSLSPSDYTIEKFHNEISTLITDYGKTNLKIPFGSANSKSVVIFIKMNDHRILLGADMEVAADSREGWKNIVDNSIVYDKKASLFKIPHHGSRNAFLDEVWNSLIEEKPIAKLTPWNRNSKLPESDMLEKYHDLSEKLYMTSLLVSDKPKKRDTKIERTIKNLDLKIKEVPFQKGAIRCRIDLNNPNDKWKVDLFGEAIEVNIS